MITTPKGCSPQMSTPTRTVALVGAHGTGKTSLINALHDKLRKDGVEVTVLPEVPRKICDRVSDPEFFRRENNTLPRQMLILLAQMTLEAEPTNALRLSDRTVLDHWAYTKLLFPQGLNANSITEPLSHFIERHCRTMYQKILYIPPEIAPVDDGTRESSTEFQRQVDEMIRALLADFGLTYDTVRGSVQERLDRAMTLIE